MVNTQRNYNDSRLFKFNLLSINFRNFFDLFSSIDVRTIIIRYFLDFEHISYLTFISYLLRGWQLCSKFAKGIHNNYYTHSKYILIATAKFRTWTFRINNPNWRQSKRKNNTTTAKLEKWTYLIGEKPKEIFQLCSTYTIYNQSWWWST